MAKGGDLPMQRVLERYGRLIAMKRRKEHWTQVLRIELVRPFNLNKLLARPLINPCYPGMAREAKAQANPHWLSSPGYP